MADPLEEAKRLLAETISELQYFERDDMGYRRDRITALLAEARAFLSDDFISIT